MPILPAVTIASAAPLDLNVIRLLGVNVKPGTSSPIGQFGTGLKYAIATLLRLEHEIEIRTVGAGGGPIYVTFSTAPLTIREKDFSSIIMTVETFGASSTSETLAFTTDLGKHWKPWMAYRELVSNAMDEGAHSVLFDVRAAKALAMCPGSLTTITVRGEAFAEVAKAETTTATGVFLHSKPLPGGIESGVEFHPNPTQSRRLYYRGIYVGDLAKPMIFTYNLTSEHQLTEDRTLSNLWATYCVIGEALFKCPAPEVQATFFSGLSEGMLEWGLEGYPPNVTEWRQPSPAFLEAAREVKHDIRRCPPWARSALLAMDPLAEREAAMLLGSDEALLAAALGMTRFMDPDCTVEAKDLRVVPSLGNNVFGLFEKGQIFISKAAFDMGESFLAATIYEEWCHKHHGHIDCHRDFQNWLLQRLTSLARELRHWEAMREAARAFAGASTDFARRGSGSASGSVAPPPPPSPLAAELGDSIPF